MAETETEVETTEGTEQVPFEFDLSFQRKIAAMALRNNNFLVQTEGLVKPEYFVEQVDGVIVKMVLDHFKTFKQTPGKTSIPTMIKDAITKKVIRKDMIEDVKKRVVELYKTDLSDAKFVMAKVAEFARHRAVEEAVLKSAELLDKGDYEKIGQIMKAAMDVGLNDDAIVYSYWDEIANRTDHRAAIKAGLIKPDGIETGFKELDDVLYHKGWGRKELSLIMAPAKGGKSMALADFAKNASLANYNVIYFTLEVSAAITADRIDANLSDTMVKELKDTPNSVKVKIETASAKAGLLEILEFPSGTLKPSDIRRMMERYRDRGINFDLIVVDYADIMAPERRTDDQIANFRSIYLDLRAIAQKYNAALLTATQTNREGAKRDTATMTDVAEDFNKIRTADLVITINASPDEVKAGEARLFFAAMRNSESGFTLQIKQDRSRMKFLTKVIGRA